MPPYSLKLDKWLSAQHYRLTLEPALQAQPHNLSKEPLPALLVFCGQAHVAKSSQSSRYRV